MIKITLVWYPSMPIACEGDDSIGYSKSRSFSLASISLVDSLIATLQKKYGGYIQLWSVL